MTERSSAGAPVAVIGAGPYGLAVTAHLRAAGLPTVVFGEPMGYWEHHMPKGMLLRSGAHATNISEPHRALGMDAFGAAEDRDIGAPIKREKFVEYGRWFQQRVAPDVDRRRVRLLERTGDGFRLTLEDGETLETGRVIVATGLERFERRVPELAGLPDTVASHSSAHPDLGAFAGRRVLVLGSGQSSLESAALLREGGAEVEVLGRRDGITWLPYGNGSRRRLRQMILPPTDVGGRVTGWLAAAPDTYRALPSGVRPVVFARCTTPAGAGWLRSRLEGVPLTMGRRIAAAEPVGGRLRLALDDGSEREVDHVLQATGYEIDLRRLPLLAPGLLAGLELAPDPALGPGSPRLGRGMESSVPGLHFVGATAAYSFGPIMRFVVGTWYAAPTVAARAAGRRQRPLRFSF